MAKRNNDSLAIKDLLKQVIKENNLAKGIQKIEVEKAWEAVMGNGVVHYTNTVKFNNGVLIVQLNSSALREELSYGLDKIIKMLNEELNEELIKKLRLI